MTPIEVQRALEGWAWQQEQERRRMLSMAWHVVALQRTRHLPSLNSLLRPRSKARDLPLSERRKEFAEMSAQVRAWKTDQGEA